MPIFWHLKCHKRYLSFMKWTPGWLCMYLITSCQAKASMAINSIILNKTITDTTTSTYLHRDAKFCSTTWARVAQDHFITPRHH